MATTNLNIRTDKAIKDQAEEIFNELGLNMTTAVNMFLRTAIREHGIPFELKLEVPNDTTAAAIDEGRKMMIPVWMRLRQLSTYEIRHSIYQSV